MSARLSVGERWGKTEGEWMDRLVQAVSSVLPLTAAMVLLLLVLRTVRVRVEWREDE